MSSKVLWPKKNKKHPQAKILLLLSHPYGGASLFVPRVVLPDRSSSGWSASPWKPQASALQRNDQNGEVTERFRRRVFWSFFLVSFQWFSVLFLNSV